jgi:hypothetical protein
VSEKPFLLALALASSLSLLTLALASASNSILLHDNLLLNGDFEAGISGWSVSIHASAITVSTPVASGDWAAELTATDTAGEIRIYQDVPVFAGATYTLTGCIYKDEPAFRYALFRIEWLDTDLPPEDSDSVADNNGSYWPITLGPIAAPPDASRARISAVAGMGTSDPENGIFFDNLTLTSNMMPRGCLPLLLSDYARQ